MVKPVAYILKSAIVLYVVELVIKSNCFMIHFPTKKEVLKMRTIHSAHFDDLKYEDEDTRIWVSRVEETPDGEPQVTIEKLVDGSWTPDEIF